MKLEQEVKLPSKDLHTFISDFKLCHNITEEIQLPFHQESGKLYVRFKGEDIQLSLQRNNDKFYSKSYLQKWGKKFMNAIKMELPKPKKTC